MAGETAALQRTSQGPKKEAGKKFLVLMSHKKQLTCPLIEKALSSVHTGQQARLHRNPRTLLSDLPLHSAVLHMVRYRAATTPKCAGIGGALQEETKSRASRHSKSEERAREGSIMRTLRRLVTEPCKQTWMEANPTYKFLKNLRLHTSLKSIIKQTTGSF